MSDNGVILRAFVCSGCNQVHLVFSDRHGCSFEIPLSEEETDALIAVLRNARAAQREQMAADPIGNCKGVA